MPVFYFCFNCLRDDTLFVCEKKIKKLTIVSVLSVFFSLVVVSRRRKYALGQRFDCRAAYKVCVKRVLTVVNNFFFKIITFERARSSSWSFVCFDF